MSPRKQKKQFTGAKQPRAHYDRKVRKAGHTRVISLGKVIPEGWEYVRIKILNKTPNTIEVLFEKLLGVVDDAQVETVNPKHQQDA